jgi:hypothetical protein
VCDNLKDRDTSSIREVKRNRRQERKMIRLPGGKRRFEMFIKCQHFSVQTTENIF